MPTIDQIARWAGDRVAVAEEFGPAAGFVRVRDDAGRECLLVLGGAQMLDVLEDRWGLRGVDTVLVESVSG